MVRIDACGVASITASQTEFDCSNVGTNTVVLTVVDVNGNTTTCNSIVTIQDIVSPEITCPADISEFATSANGAVVTLLIQQLLTIVQIQLWCKLQGCHLVQLSQLELQLFHIK